MWSDFTVKRVDPDRRSGGVVLLTVGRNTRSINKTSDREAVIAIDRQGRIVLKEVALDGTVAFEAGMADPGAGPDRGWNGFRPEYLPADVADKLRPHAG